MILVLCYGLELPFNLICNIAISIASDGVFSTLEDTQKKINGVYGCLEVGVYWVPAQWWEVGNWSQDYGFWDERGSGCTGSVK